MESCFALHPALLEASVEICDLSLCHVRLQDDARWPWLVLVPRRADRSELSDLDACDRAALTADSMVCEAALRRVCQDMSVPIARLNWGALGNVTPQLHIHIVARWPADPAWPGPVWGKGSPEPYERARRESMIDRLRRALTA